MVEKYKGYSGYYSRGVLNALDNFLQGKNRFKINVAKVSGFSSENIKELTLKRLLLICCPFLLPQLLVRSSLMYKTLLDRVNPMPEEE